MQKIFWDNPYQQSLRTKVASANGNQFLFEETIVFSFSGGQESDIATINKLPILDSEIKGNLIYYALEDGHGLEVGADVTMEIDWPRRYRLMRLHFAAELILELVTRKLNIEKIGAHISEHKARIDFFCNKNIANFFAEILKEYENIIMRDLPIKKDFSDVEKQRRYWEITGFARVPCGGTHVKSTKEVGLVSLKRKNVGAGKERIEITLVNG